MDIKKKYVSFNTTFSNKQIVYLNVITQMVIHSKKKNLHFRKRIIFSENGKY